MVRLKIWQWIVLAMPIATIIIFLLVSAGLQIHTWGISWVWAIFTLVFVGWRWLLVKWTKPTIQQIESVFAEVREELESTRVHHLQSLAEPDAFEQAEVSLQEILTIAAAIAQFGKIGKLSGLDAKI